VWIAFGWNLSVWLSWRDLLIEASQLPAAVVQMIGIADHHFPIASGQPALCDPVDLVGRPALTAAPVAA
jgi:hypothetical protein